MTNEKMVIKLCQNASALDFKALQDLFNQMPDLEKIYYNLYVSSKERKKSGLQKYTTDVAEKVLRKSLKLKAPFFINAYKPDCNELFIAKMQKYVLLYIIVSKPCVTTLEEDIFKWVDNLFQKGLINVGYACSSLDNWWCKNKNTNERIKDFRRREIYSQHNTLEYNYESMEQYIKQNEVWYPACWKVWLGNSIFSDLIANDSVMQQLECFQMIEYNPGGLFIQLHKEMSHFSEYENELRRLKLYHILSK